MRACMFGLLLLGAANLRAQDAPAPLPPMPNERPAGLFTAELALGGDIRIHGGRVNGARLPLDGYAGLGVNFTERWGVELLGRASFDALAPCCSGRDRWLALGALRSGRRISDFWGAGPAWRRGAGAAREERGWAAVYRMNGLDHPFNYAVTISFGCLPGQCAASIGLSAGLYF